MKKKPSLTKKVELLLIEFFSEVENRIPSEATKVFNKAFCILCRAHKIPNSDRDILAQSLFSDKPLTVSSAEVKERILALEDNVFYKLNVAHIKTAAAEKRIIDGLRERLFANFKPKLLSSFILKRLEILLELLPTSNDPYTINGIYNLIDEAPRLGIKQSIIIDYVQKQINSDPLLNPKINSQAKTLLRYLKF